MIINFIFLAITNIIYNRNNHNNCTSSYCDFKVNYHLHSNFSITDDNIEIMDKSDIPNCKICNSCFLRLTSFYNHFFSSNLALHKEINGNSYVIPLNKLNQLLCVDFYYKKAIYAFLNNSLAIFIIISKDDFITNNFNIEDNTVILGTLDEFISLNYTLHGEDDNFMQFLRYKLKFKKKHLKIHDKISLDRYISYNHTEIKKVESNNFSLYLFIGILSGLILIVIIKVIITTKK